MVTTDATGRPEEAVSLDGIERRFRRWLRQTAAEAIRDRIEAYVEAIEDVLGGIVARESLDDAPAFYARFLATLEDDPLAEAGRRRAEVFNAVAALAEPPLELPETMEVEPGPSPLPPPEPLVRANWAQRAALRLRRRERRDVAVGRLARLYGAEAARRLEPVLNDVARLHSIALDGIRQRLHHVPTDGGPDAEAARSASGERTPAGDPPAAEPPIATERIRADAERAKVRLDGVVDEINDAFARALRAPAVSVDEDDVEASAREAGRAADLVRSGWGSMESALLANARSEAVLARALAELDRVRTKTTGELERFVSISADAPLRALSEGLRALAEASTERALDELRANANRLFEDQAAGYADRLESVLADAASAFKAKLEPIPGLVPDELLISEDTVARIPPRPVRIDLRDAPVEELFATTCGGVLPRWIDRELADAGDEIRVLQRELDRLRNAVDFHIRAARRGGFADEHDAQKLVVGILSRSADQVDDLAETGLGTLHEVVDGLDGVIADEAETIRAAVAERKFMRIRSEIAEEQAVRHLSAGLDWSRRVIDSAMGVGRRGWAFGRRGLAIGREWTQRQLGVGQVEREEMLESLEQSLLEEGVSADLPPLYRQLFDVEAEVPWEELLVSRDAELATLRRAYERATRGQPAAVAIVGEKGSGKTTLVRLATNRILTDRSVRSIELERTVGDEAGLAAVLAAGLRVDEKDLDGLAEALARGPRTAVVIEDAHHLFTRALGGFAVLESFLQLMARTQGTVFWIITIDEYAWNYLDRAVGLSPHFTHEINTTNIPSDKLEAAVMARHEVSGYALEFETSHAARKRTLLDRILGRAPEGELSQREAQRQAYFRELNQIAEGNIFLALYYWLRSIDRVDDHALIIHDPEMVDVEFLDRLPLPSLHSIATIILHGGISEAEHQRIFQLTPAESRLQLASLVDSHLIFRSADDGEFKINKVLYRPFIRLLRSKNIF